MKLSITDQVAEESGVGEVDLIPVVRVQPGSLIFRDVIVQLDLVHSLSSCLEDVETFRMPMMVPGLTQQAEA